MTATVIEKEMGFTHPDFYRDIQRVLDVDGYRVHDNGIIAEDGTRRLQIELAEQTHRMIGLIRLPVTHVTFTFDGYGEADITAFFQLYDRVFRRGGG